MGNVFFGPEEATRRAQPLRPVGIAGRHRYRGISVARLAAAIPALAAFIVIYGIAHQGPVFGVPLTIAESLGLRRFGSLSGMIGFVSTLAGSLGPVAAAGRLFDATGSYRAPFTMFLVSLIVATILPIGCVPLARTAPEEPHDSRLPPTKSVITGREKVRQGLAGNFCRLARLRLCLKR